MNSWSVDRTHRGLKHSCMQCTSIIVQCPHVLASSYLFSGKVREVNASQVRLSSEHISYFSKLIKQPDIIGDDTYRSCSSVAVNALPCQTPA